MRSMSTVNTRDAFSDDLDELTAVLIACFNELPWHDGWTFEAARERLEPILLARQFRGAIALEKLRREGTEKAYLLTGPDGGAAAFFAAHGYYPSRSRIVVASLFRSS